MDDIFGIWQYGEKSLKEFYETANKIHPRIKLTLEYSQDGTTFLDTKVKLINGVIVTELYTKPTDQHLYLHSKSDHPDQNEEGNTLWVRNQVEKNMFRH